MYGTAHNNYFGSYTAVGTGVAPPNAGTQDAKVEDLIPYFGIPQNPEQLKGDNAFVTRRQLPFAYKDKNILISTKIEGLIIKNPEEILSAEYGAPPTKTDSLQFSVVSYYFDEGMLDVEPEEGVARHMRFAQRKASGTMIRKSKGMHFEHGFLYSPEGRRLYQLQQVQLANTVVNDMIYHTLFALRESRHASIEYEVRDGLYPSEFVDCVLQKNREFACFQKYPRGASDLLDKISNELQTRAGVTPNSVICSRGLEQFWKGQWDFGPSNNPNSVEIPSQTKTLDVSSKNNIKLIFTRLFQNKITGQLPIDPLIRERVNGEYYVMAPAAMELVLDYGLENYKTSHRNIKVMDFENRRWGTITLDDALRSSPIFDEAGINLLQGHASKDHHNSLFRVTSNERLQNVQVTRLGELGPEILPDNFVIAMTQQYAAKMGNFIETFIPLVPEEPFEGAGTEMKLLGKRSLESFSGSKLVPVMLKASGDIMDVSISIDDLHNQNKTRLAQNLQTQSVSGVYDNVMATPGIKADRFAAKIDHVLSSADTSGVENLRTHLTLLSDPDTMVKKRTESLKYFNEVVPEKSSLKSSPVAKTGGKLYFVSPAYLDLHADKLEVASVDADHPEGVYDLDSYKDCVSLWSMKASTKAGKKLDFGELQTVENIATRWDRLRASFAGGNAAALASLMNLELNFATFQFLINNNIIFPLTLLVFRPWMQWVTSTIIAMRGGSETVVNFYMQPDVMLQDDATTKTHSAHVTMHLTPFVKSPGNIKVVDDVAVRRYLGGGNVVPFKIDDIKDLAVIDNWNVTHSKGSASYFALPVAITHSTKIPSVIDFRGYFFSSNRGSAEPHFITAHTNFEDAVFSHPDPLHPNTPPAPETAMDSPYNSICTQGTQLCFNYKTKDWTAIIRGQDSCWSGMVYPDMMRVIEGMESLLKPPDYSDISKYPPYEMYH